MCWAGRGAQTFKWEDGGGRGGAPFLRRAFILCPALWKAAFGRDSFFFFFPFCFLSVLVIHFAEVTWRKARHRPLPTEAKVGTVLPSNAPGFRQRSQPGPGRSSIPSCLLHPAPRVRSHEGHFSPMQVMPDHSAHAQGTAPSLGLGIAAGPAMGRAGICQVPV